MPNSPTEPSLSEFAVVLLNAEGLVIDAQTNSPTVLGWTREELIGQDVGVLLKTGRDMIVEHLAHRQNPQAEELGHTSLSLKVLAKRKNKSQFPARVAVRPFTQLNCWTAAFYSHVSAVESETLPNVSNEEIGLATKALQERANEIPTNEGGMTSAPPKKAMTGENALWRTAKLLVRSRKDQPTSQPPPLVEQAPEVQTISEPEPLPPPEAAAPMEQEPEAFQQEEQIPEEVQPFQPVVESEVQEAAIIPLEQEFQPVAPEEFIPEFEQPTADMIEIQKEPAAAVQQEHTSPFPLQNSSELVRLRSELERERGLRTRAEQRAVSLNSQVQALNLQLNETLAAENANSSRTAELENEVENSQQLLAEERARLEKESRERSAAEEQLQMLKELNSQLEASMLSFEESNRVLQQEKDDLQRQLQAAQNALRESELAREGEMKKRQEMELRMTTAVREQQDAEARSKNEVTKAESALRASELKCKKLEADLLRSQARATEQERQACRHAEEFRSRLREPVTNLNQTASLLLQSGLPDDQKEMMEIMLREVISVENSLRERIGASPEAQAH